MKSKRTWTETSKLKTRSPFSDLFPIDEQLIKTITEHMRANGYDDSQPIVVWPKKDQLFVVDGHTRLKAAIEADITTVYIARME